MLRRLYSTFAGSWPGIGLLLMRGVVGAVVVAGTGRNLWHELSLRLALSSASLAVAGLLLVAGPLDARGRSGRRPDRDLAES